MKKVDVNKKLTPHQKDLPRHKVIHQYEKEFKNNYRKSLETGFELLLKRALKMVKKKNV